MLNKISDSDSDSGPHLKNLYNCDQAFLGLEVLKFLYAAE